MKTGRLIGVACLGLLAFFLEEGIHERWIPATKCYSKKMLSLGSFKPDKSNR
jgi:hypothetical protein